MFKACREHVAQLKWMARLVALPVFAIYMFVAAVTDYFTPQFYIRHDIIIGIRTAVTLTGWTVTALYINRIVRLIAAGRQDLWLYLMCGIVITWVALGHAFLKDLVAVFGGAPVSVNANLDNWTRLIVATAYAIGGAFHLAVTQRADLRPRQVITFWLGAMAVVALVSGLLAATITARGGSL